ncbi:hypothetical protein QQG55_37415 [Brugia pahangi]
MLKCPFFQVPAQLTSYMKSKGIFPKQICPISCDDDRKLSVVERGYPNIQTTSRTRRRMLPAVPCEEVQNMHINPTRIRILMKSRNFDQEIHNCTND